MARFVSVLLLLTALVPGDVSADLESLTLEPLATNVPLIASVTHAGDRRLFVSLVGGEVRIFEDGGFLPQPFLDLTGRVFNGVGLWSIEFDPGFAANGLAFVHWAEIDSGDSLISRFRVSDDPDRIDPASEVTLLRIPKSEMLHYGGALHFGPDGCLYVSTATAPVSTVAPIPSASPSPATAWRARSCVSTSTASTSRPTTRSLPAIPSPAPAAARSGPMGCAIPGGSASTARPGTCGSRTSAKASAKRSTSSPPAAPAARTTAGR